MSHVGILANGSRVALPKVHKLWSASTILPGDPGKARSIIEARKSTTFTWQAFRPAPNFRRQVAKNLGFHFEHDLIPRDQWEPVERIFCDKLRSDHPDLIGEEVYFISMFGDGVVADGARYSCATTVDGFLDDMEFYCKFDFGEVEFFLAKDGEPNLHPDWYYEEELASSAKEYAENDLYHSGVYTYTADLALSIISKYRAGHPGMEPPRYEPPQRRDDFRAQKVLKEVKDKHGNPYFALCEVKPDKSPKGDQP